MGHAPYPRVTGRVYKRPRGERVRHWVLVVVVFWAHGCAFQSAMREGGRLAAAGDWAGAYAAYSRANEVKPDDIEAEKALAEAREYAVEDALTSARAAIDTGDYETAKKSLDQVIRIDADNPEVFDLTRDLERTMAAHFERLWGANDPTGAYDFAIRQRGVIPKGGHVQENVDRARAYFAAEAARLTAAKEHERALGLLKVIVDHEPDRRSEVDAIDRQVRIAWADHLVATSATMAKAGRTGAAAAHLARAHEIAGRAGDLAKGKELALSLAPQARFSMTLDVTGDAWRVAPVKDALTQGFTAIPDAAFVASDPVLAVRVTLKPHKCTEADTVTPTSLEYVSGQVEKPNAEWNELAAAYEQARTDEAGARAQVEDLAPKLETASAVVAKLDAAVAQLQKLTADVTAAFEDASRQATAARTRRDELEAQLDQVLASGGSSADAQALQAQIADATSIMDQWAAKASENEQAEGLAKRKLQEFDGQRSAATQAHQSLVAAHASADQDRAAAEKLANELTSKLSATPKTVWEDVKDVHRYDVHDWKRTCVAAAALTMRPRWKTQLGVARNFDPTAAIEDRAYAGFEKANLAADPKLYPTSDKELVALADAETVKAVVEWTRTLADDAYRDRVSATMLAIEAAPVDAATAVLALLLGAPARLDQATIDAFHAYLEEDFGLQQPALLTGSGS